ncbi:MAG: hypothetical protein SGJ21_17255 [Alphaproteobacteria bacterium]|nr:hypothetical protein [Alphaproteobacteria bacterium]
MRGVRTMASWVLALFLGVMFLWIGDQTLFPPSPGKNVVFPLLSESSGIYLFEPTGRFVVGVLDILAALLVLAPWTRRVGAILAFLIAAGAVAAHALWLGTAIPSEFGSTETDGGQLFNLALALLAASLLLIFVHPGRAKAAVTHGR